MAGSMLLPMIPAQEFSSFAEAYCLSREIVSAPGWDFSSANSWWILLIRFSGPKELNAHKIKLMTMITFPASLTNIFALLIMVCTTLFHLGERYVGNSRMK